MIQGEETFDVREYAVCKILYDRVEDRLVEDLLLHQPECRVQRTEYQTDQSQNQKAFQEGECHSEQTVDPAQHREFKDRLKQSADDS